MPATVQHVLSATTPDDPAWEIRPSHWNSNHAVSLNIAASEISALFANDGNVSFGTNGAGLITATANAGGGGDGFNRISAGTQIAATNATVLFETSPTVTFGMNNNSVVTASVATNYQSQGAYLTTAALSNHSHGDPQLNLTNLSGTTASNSAGFTLSLSAGNYLTTAALSNHSHGNPTLALTNLSGTTASASNGLTLSLSAVNALTTARASTDAIGLNTAGTNVTWTANSSGLSLNAAGYAGTNTTFNGANVSGSMTQNSAGLQLSLSVAAPGAAAENNAINLLGANTAGNTTATGSTIGWSGINATLSGANNSQVVISVPATSSLVGSSGLSMSSNGASMSLYPVARSEWNNIVGLSLGGAAQGNSIVSIQPFSVEWPLVFSNIFVGASFAVGSQTNNSSAYLDLFASGVIYSRNGSTLSSVASWSRTETQSWSSNGTGTVAGMKAITATLAGTTLTPGNYWHAIHVSTTNSATGGANTTALGATCTMVVVYGISSNIAAFAFWNGATNATQGFGSGLGAISTGATLATIPFSSITVTGTRALNAPVAFGLRNATYQ